MKRQQIAIILAGIMLSSPVLALEEMGTIYSKGALLMEKESKRILYERGAKNTMPMASTTKIMTCIIALENNDLSEVIVASQRASRAPKVKLGLQTGEKQTLGDMLYSLMLESHNDSAVAIAEHVGGSVEAFCEMMTRKAHEIGAVDTSFETPSGLDGEKHYSTPYDMALIAAYALDHPKFIEITNTLEMQIPSKELKGSRPHHLINKNRFIREYPGALGMKTGYTSKAGHCFVGAAKRKEMELIGVALGAGCDKAAKTRKYTDVKTMMNYGYANYAKYKIVDKDLGAGTVLIKDGKKKQVEAVYQETLVLPLSKEEKEQVKIKVSLPEQVEAPVEVGQVLGEAEVVCNEQVIGTTQVVAKEAVIRASFLDKVKDLFNKIKK